MSFRSSGTMRIGLACNIQACKSGIAWSDERLVAPPAAFAHWSHSLSCLYTQSATLHTQSGPQIPDETFLQRPTQQRLGVWFR
eukprot:5224745-Amphidinium_carterae.1